MKSQKHTCGWLESTELPISRRDLEFLSKSLSKERDLYRA